MTLRALWNTLFGRRWLRAKPGYREKVLTIASVLTVFRACASGALLIVAIASDSRTLLLVGLAVSLLLDFADGTVARFRGAVTTFGAQLDGHADRLAALLVVIGVVILDGDALTVAAAVVVWVQFGIVDGFLANQYLRFGLWSPDHFHQVDERVWRENWSAGAKLASNMTMVLLAAGGPATSAALVLAVALVVMRLVSYQGVRYEARQLAETPYAERSASPPTVNPRRVGQAAEMPEDAPGTGLPRIIAR